MIILKTEVRGFHKHTHARPHTHTHTHTRALARWSRTVYQFTDGNIVLAENQLADKERSCNNYIRGQSLVKRNPWRLLLLKMIMNNYLLVTRSSWEYKSRSKILKISPKFMEREGPYSEQMNSEYFRIHLLKVHFNNDLPFTPRSNKEQHP
jgi:hypothetical protein